MFQYNNSPFFSWRDSGCSPPSTLCFNTTTLPFSVGEILVAARPLHYVSIQQLSLFQLERFWLQPALYIMFQYNNSPFFSWRDSGCSPPSTLCFNTTTLPFSVGEILVAARPLHYVSIQQLSLFQLERFWLQPALYIMFQYNNSPFFSWRDSGCSPPSTLCFNTTTLPFSVGEILVAARPLHYVSIQQLSLFQLERFWLQPALYIMFQYNNSPFFSWRDSGCSPPSTLCFNTTTLPFSAGEILVAARPLHYVSIQQLSLFQLERFWLQPALYIMFQYNNSPFFSWRDSGCSPPSTLCFNTTTLPFSAGEILVAARPLHYVSIQQLSLFQLERFWLQPALYIMFQYNNSPFFSWRDSGCSPPSTLCFNTTTLPFSAGEILVAARPLHYVSIQQLSLFQLERFWLQPALYIMFQYNNSPFFSWRDSGCSPPSTLCFNTTTLPFSAGEILVAARPLHYVSIQQLSLFQLERFWLQPALYIMFQYNNSPFFSWRDSGCSPPSTLCFNTTTLPFSVGEILVAARPLHYVSIQQLSLFQLERFWLQPALYIMFQYNNFPFFSWRDSGCSPPSTLCFNTTPFFSWRDSGCSPPSTLCFNTTTLPFSAGEILVAARPLHYVSIQQLSLFQLERFWLQPALYIMFQYNNSPFFSWRDSGCSPPSTLCFNTTTLPFSVGEILVAARPLHYVSIQQLSLFQLERFWLQPALYIMFQYNNSPFFSWRDSGCSPPSTLCFNTTTLPFSVGEILVAARPLHYVSIQQLSLFPLERFWLQPALYIMFQYNNSPFFSWRDSGCSPPSTLCFNTTTLPFSAGEILVAARPLHYVSIQQLSLFQLERFWLQPALYIMFQYNKSPFFSWRDSGCSPPSTLCFNTTTLPFSAGEILVAARPLHYVSIQQLSLFQLERFWLQPALYIMFQYNNSPFFSWRDSGCSPPSTLCFNTTTLPFSVGEILVAARPLHYVSIQQLSLFQLERFWLQPALYIMFQYNNSPFSVGEILVAARPLHYVSIQQLSLFPLERFWLQPALYIMFQYNNSPFFSWRDSGCSPPSTLCFNTTTLRFSVGEILVAARPLHYVSIQQLSLFQLERFWLQPALYIMFQYNNSPFFSWRDSGCSPPSTLCFNTTTLPFSVGEILVAARPLHYVSIQQLSLFQLERFWLQPALYIMFQYNNSPIFSWRDSGCSPPSTLCFNTTTLPFSVGEILVAARPLHYVSIQQLSLFQLERFWLQPALYIMFQYNNSPFFSWRDSGCSPPSTLCFNTTTLPFSVGEILVAARLYIMFQYNNSPFFSWRDSGCSPPSTLCFNTTTLPFSVGEILVAARPLHYVSIQQLSLFQLERFWLQPALYIMFQYNNSPFFSWRDSGCSPPSTLCFNTTTLPFSAGEILVAARPLHYVPIQQLSFFQLERFWLQPALYLALLAGIGLNEILNRMNLNNYIGVVMPIAIILLGLRIVSYTYLACL